MIFPHFSAKEVLHDSSWCKHVSWHTKTVTRYPQVDWYFYGAYRRARILSEAVGKRLSYGGNVYPTYSRDLERCHLLYIRELQRQASGSSPARISQRIVAIYTQITLHDLEQARILYFTLPRLPLQWLFERESAMERKNKVYILSKNLYRYLSRWIWITVTWERIMCEETVKGK